MATEIAHTDSPSLITKFSSRYGVDPNKMMATLKATAFKQKDGTVPSNEQMMALMVVADQYGLNPFTREIYAFPDKQNGIVPVVGVDGWSRIINTHPQFDGMEFNYAQEMENTLFGQKVPSPAWCECVMYRKDRSHPVKVTEYLDEVYRPPFVKNKGSSTEYVIAGPWQTHTKRFLRHKTMIQTARLAFGFVGIFDEDEAQRIAENNTVDAQIVSTQSHQSYSDEQKSTFDQIIRDDDAIALHLMTHYIDDNIYADLFNSGAQGEKTELKNKCQDLLHRGRQMVRNIETALSNSDAVLAIENFDCSNTGEALLRRHLGREEIDNLNDLIKIEE